MGTTPNMQQRGISDAEVEAFSLIAEIYRVESVDIYEAVDITFGLLDELEAYALAWDAEAYALGNKDALQEVA